MHWINVIAFSLLLMSGLQIFIAYLSLNGGKSSYNGHAPLLQMGALRDPQGQLVDIAGGKGGYWEDCGYEWFAGI